MFIRKTINSAELDRFEDRIPGKYVTDIARGELSAGAIWDEVGGESYLMLVYVIGKMEGWMEIVWASFSDPKAVASEKADLLRFMIREEQDASEEELIGTYCEIHAQEIRSMQHLSDVMLMTGMETTVADNSVYEFTLADVAEKDFLGKAAKAMKCLSLRAAGNDVLDRLEAAIEGDERPTPLPLFIKWQLYLKDESVICLKNGAPCGLLLLSMHGKYLVVDCAYVTDKLALSAMLGNAFLYLTEHYPPEQKLLIPVVMKRTGEIVKRLAPNAHCGEMVQGVLWF